MRTEKKSNFKAISWVQRFDYYNFDPLNRKSRVNYYWPAESFFCRKWIGSRQQEFNNACPTGNNWWRSESLVGSLPWFTIERHTNNTFGVWINWILWSSGDKNVIKTIEINSIKHSLSWHVPASRHTSYPRFVCFESFFWSSTHRASILSSDIVNRPDSIKLKMNLQVSIYKPELEPPLNYSFVNLYEAHLKCNKNPN